jgi:hypothetical protein
MVAAVKMTTVPIFNLRGVSQVAWCACSQERVALAPVIAASAQPAHIYKAYCPT